jgi:hypothetical protein
MKRKFNTVQEAMPAIMEAYGLSLKSDHASVSHRKKFSALVDISDQTLRIWAGGLQIPNGINLITMLHLGELAGIETSEHSLSNVHEIIREMRSALVFRVKTKRELAVECGYGKDEAILELILRRRNLTSGRLHAIESAIAPLRSALGTLERQYAARAKELLVKQSVHAQSHASPSPAISHHSHNGSSLTFPELEQMGAYITLLLPLAERLHNDSTSEGIALRKRLRDITPSGSSNKVFILSNLLTGLCGERALKQ